MNWRRVAEKMRLLKAVQLMDDRRTHAREGEEKEAELTDLAAKVDAQTVAVAEISRQARLGSYSRVKVPR